MLSALIAAAPEADRIYCTGQMGGLIAVDEEWRPLSNYISWRDQRTLGHLFHAAFRAMADNYARVASGLSPADWKVVVWSGGLTQSVPLLRRLIEQRFRVSIRESDDEETMLGLLDIAISIAS